MAYTKTNETWFGDSFNRAATITAYNCSIDSDTLKGLCESTGSSGLYDISFNCNGGVTYAKGAASHAEGRVATISEVDNLKDELKKVQAQFENLQKKWTKNNELRSTLKTLQYIREVD